MKKTVFTGMGTAIITPMTKDGIDYETLGRLIEFQIESGIDAIVVMGTTGENATIEPADQKKVIEYTVKKVAKRVPVVAGTGTNNTEHVIANTKAACEVGADAVLVVTPYYNKATQSGLVQHFTMVADVSTVPVIMYNVPGRTGVEIQPATMAKIAEIPNIAGIKDAGGNMSKTMETFRLVREKCDVYSGEDALNFPILACGGVGVISVVSNIAPKEVKELCTLVKAGKLDEAIRLNDRLLPLANACFVEVNPIPVKEAVNLLGFNAGTPRAPLTVIEPQNREKLACAMKNFGLEIKA